MIAIEVTNLTKSYDSTIALDGLNLQVRDGEVVAIAGPDGAGKTTLFRCICGLLDFDHGEIHLLGHDVTKELDQIKPLLGYMPQTFALYPDLSVEENLRFFAGIFGVSRSEFNERVKRLYEFSRLGSFARRKAGNLSGGMKQKLALCCNLIHNPRVLVLDEPTRGVDPLSRRQFWEILRTLNRQGATILVSTPYMDELERADRCIFISSGKKLAEGTTEELIRSYRRCVYSIPLVPREQLIGLEAAQWIEVRRLGGEIRIYATPGITIDEIIEKLRKGGIGVEGLRQVEPSLEDVFVSLIGS